jgi:hypothetical protein
MSAWQTGQVVGGSRAALLTDPPEQADRVGGKIVFEGFSSLVAL